MALSKHNVDLKCPICLELLSDPKELSCSHTFCQICLGHILGHSSQNISNHLACLICKTKTLVPGGNVGNLKTNESMKSRTDSVRDSQQLCEICDSKIYAIHFCSVCGKFMCDTCLENHNKWPPHLKHEVVRVADIREGRAFLKKKVFCQEHKSRQQYVCTDVCITCKKLICMRCVIDHKVEGHIVQDAEEYNDSYKAKFQSQQDQAKAKTATINSHVAYIVSQKKNISDHIDGIKAEISKVCQEKIKKLNESKAASNIQLDALEREIHHSLDGMKHNDESMIASIESASSLVGRSLKAPLSGSNIAIRGAVFGELQNLLNEPDPEKELASDVANHAEQLVFRPNDQGDELKIGEVRFVKCELKCDVELSKKNSMNAMAATPNGEMAVAYTGGIDFFSADGQLQETVLRDANIHGVGFLSDGRFVVIRPPLGMSLYTQDYRKTSATFRTESINEVGLLWRPQSTSRLFGLAVDRVDQIYVGNGNVKKIQVFSPAGGNVIREIPWDRYVAWQITSDYDKHLIHDTDTIRVIDEAGNTKHTMQKPYAFPYAAVTQRRSILIAWVKHDDGLVSIDEYTNEMKYIQTLISDHKIEKPTSNWYYLQEFRSGEIAFCTPDRLYIFRLTITPVHIG